MNRLPLYPLQFAPIYQYRPWGGRRLAELLSAPLPGGCGGDHSASFAPQPGDVVFVEAGTVHSLSDLVVFEVQENSEDVST